MKTRRMFSSCPYDFWMVCSTRPGPGSAGAADAATGHITIVVARAAIPHAKRATIRMAANI
jgi:hypothetical protein